MDETDKRVIDYNDIISEKLKQIRKSIGEEKISEDGFHAGLNPIDVNEVLTGDEQIVGDESYNHEGAYEEEISLSSEEVLAEAQAEADDIINRAGQDANAIIERAKEEAEMIRNQAREDGYAEGKAMAEEEVQTYISQANEELKAQESQLINEYRKKEEELEPALVETILNIFSEITRAVSVDKKDMILALVNNVMSGGDACRNYIIKACNEDAAFLRDNKDKIVNSVRNDIHIEIVADPTMKKNECLIDTDTGVYDCSLDIQLENLVNDIRILSCTGE